MHQKPLASLPLLLFHGLLSSPQEFGLLAHTLRSQSIQHKALEVTGYSIACGSGEMDWHKWHRAGLEAVVNEGGNTQPVVLGGLCVGGMLATTVASLIPDRVAGLILMSPTFAYDGWGLSPLRHLRKFSYWSRLDRFFSVKERPPFGLKNEKMRKWIMRELQARAVSAAGPARISLRALREADRMTAHALQCLQRHDLPLLVIHARDDEIARLSSVERIFDALPNRDKELVVLENSYHMVSIDNDRRQVANLISAFVQRLSKQGIVDVLAGVPGVVSSSAQYISASNVLLTT